MKSLLSHKRSPEEKLEKTIEKMENKTAEKNEEKKNEEKKDEDINNEINKEEGNNNEKENKENLNKKRIKKVIKKNNKPKKDKSQENQNKEKEEGNIKQKAANKNISDYFNFSGKKESNHSQVETNLEDNKNLNNLDINQMELEQKENKEITPKDGLKEINQFINKKNIFSFENNNNIKYDNSYIREITNIPENIKDFYSLDSNIINENNKKEYFSKLTNYFKEFNSINNIGKNDEINTQNKKLVFIHNSFAPLKKIPKEQSHLINPRNYLTKDEYIIDYEKDSEDEFMEENAEDIKSSDNEDKEEDEEEDANSQQDDHFIVPDGHLSEEELSDKDIMEERKLLESSRERQLDAKTILNIRKNFTKPILIDFSKNKNDKCILLLNKLTIGLFNFEEEKENINENNMEVEPDENKEEGNNNEAENKNNNNSFPIIIGNKVNKYKGIEDSIKIHFEDILRKVHGSYDTKEHLILELNKKFEDITKKTLNSFFKEKCYKIQKKYWMVQKEILDKFNVKQEDIEQYKKENFNIYKEKEEKKQKELEEIKKKEGIIPPQNSEENKNNNEGGSVNNNKEEKEKDKNNKEKKQKGKSKSRSKAKNNISENNNLSVDIFLKPLSDNKTEKKREDNKDINVLIHENTNIQLPKEIFNIQKVSEIEKKEYLLNKQANTKEEDIDIDEEKNEEKKEENTHIFDIEHEENKEIKNEEKKERKKRNKGERKSKSRKSNVEEEEKKKKKDHKKDNKDEKKDKNKEKKKEKSRSRNKKSEKTKDENENEGKFNTKNIEKIFENEDKKERKKNFKKKEDKNEEKKENKGKKEKDKKSKKENIKRAKEKSERKKENEEENSNNFKKSKSQDPSSPSNRSKSSKKSNENIKNRDNSQSRQFTIDKFFN